GVVDAGRWAATIEVLIHQRTMPKAWPAFFVLAPLWPPESGAGADALCLLFIRTGAPKVTAPPSEPDDAATPRYSGPFSTRTCRCAAARHGTGGWLCGWRGTGAVSNPDGRNRCS